MKLKKRVLILLCGCFLLTGCFGKSSNSVDKFIKKVNKAKNYYLTGNLQIINNEDTYNYDVKVSYKKDDYFKVSLINKTNDHEQIILKNDEGVYV